MIRLIAMDVDGTLVPDGCTNINPVLLDTISKLHDQGICLAIASGREWSSVEWLFRPVLKKIFYLADNGAYVGMHGRSLFSHNVPQEYAVETFRRIRQHPGLIPVGSDREGYVLDTHDDKLYDWLANGYHANVRFTDDLTKVKDFLKVSAYDRTYNIEKTGEEIREAMQGKLQITNAGTMWLDLNAPGVSKGEAVRILQDSLSISPEETMAFGDQSNDISMFESAKYSFAVANAVPEAKAAARFEADANTRDGVLKILQLLL